MRRQEAAPVDPHDEDDEEEAGDLDGDRSPAHVARPEDVAQRPIGHVRGADPEDVADAAGHAEHEEKGRQRGVGQARGDEELVAGDGAEREEGQRRQRQRGTALQASRQGLDVDPPGDGDEAVAKGAAAQGEQRPPRCGAQGADDRQRHDGEPLVEVKVGQHRPRGRHEGGHGVEAHGQRPDREPDHVPTPW